MVYGFEITLIDLITSDGGQFEMAPRVWQHFGVLSGTPTTSRKTLSQMAVPLPKKVSQHTAAALIEWCKANQLPISPKSVPTTNVGLSPLDYVRPSASERRLSVTAPLVGNRAFWSSLTPSQMQEMVVAAKACFIPRLQAEAEWYLEDVRRDTKANIYNRPGTHGNSRCAKCNRCQQMEPL